ncbi:MAG: hypothetical protein L6R35_001634 [Caloplaca aegaea]|nr:MAG: hypothetical protein L6R35_001634 [Caloplaca aegaea]
MASSTQSTGTFGESQELEDNRTPIRIPRLDLESPIRERAPFRRVNYQSLVSVTCPWRSSALKAVDPQHFKPRQIVLTFHACPDAQLTDPGLLKKHSSLRSYTTSFGVYLSIRVFKREHPQADKLPSKPTPLPLLVFIHGLGGGLAQFHPLLTSLVNVAPCLGLDLPGCGRSSFSPTTWKAYSQPALVELLARVIADYCEVNSGQGVVLISHSMGCSLSALVASTESPLKAMGIDVLGLIAICPKVTSLTQRELKLFRMFLSLPTPILDLWRYWDRRGGTESASVARFVGPGADIETKKLQERFNIQSRSGVWRRMAWGFVCDNHTASLETWATLAIPIFLIGGESDGITSPREVSAISHMLNRKEWTDLGKPMVSISNLNLQSGGKDAVVDGRVKSRATIVSGDESQPSENRADPTPDKLKKHQVLKTTILPAPAGHSLLYDPTTYRTLAGLIQAYLLDHIDSRLSLGWQLQYLCTEGKWDVKNLAKWEVVTPVSEPIAGVFRAMKTLREVDEKHCPEVFVRKWKGKLKAVVDISYENPVYDPRGLEDGGMEYYKFPTVSKIPPTADEVRDFIKLVDKIRHADPAKAATDALIGVHCHYGFNRTGFFICSYLIEKEHYGVQQAIDEFRAQRPPGIRHDHFLDTLFLRALQR